MKRREFLQLTGVSVAGCATTWDRDMRTAPRLREARDILWRFYGNHPLPPDIRLIQDRDLNCHVNRPDRPGWMREGGCVDEVCPSLTMCSVAYHGEPWHETALPHALLHLALWHETGDPDIGHMSLDWGWRLSEATAALAATGM